MRVYGPSTGINQETASHNHDPDVAPRLSRAAAFQATPRDIIRLGHCRLYFGPVMLLERVIFAEVRGGSARIYTPVAYDLIPRARGCTTTGRNLPRASLSPSSFGARCMSEDNRSRDMSESDLAVREIRGIIIFNIL